MAVSENNDVLIALKECLQPRDAFWQANLERFSTVGAALKNAQEILGIKAFEIKSDEEANIWAQELIHIEAPMIGKDRATTWAHPWHILDRYLLSHSGGYKYFEPFTSKSFFSVIGWCLPLAWNASRFHTLVRIAGEIIRPLPAIIISFLGKYMVDLLAGTSSASWQHLVISQSGRRWRFFFTF